MTMMVTTLPTDAVLWMTSCLLYLVLTFSAGFLVSLMFRDDLL